MLSRNARQLLRKVTSCGNIQEGRLASTCYHTRVPTTYPIVLRSSGRVFSSATDNTGADAGDIGDKKKKSLRDSVNRIKGDQTEESESDSGSGNTDSSKEGPSFLSTAWDELQSTWNELVESDKPKDIDKQIHVSQPGKASDDDDEAAKQYDLMVIDPQEHLNAFERIQKRLSEAPIIQGTSFLSLH